MSDPLWSVYDLSKCNFSVIVGFTATVKKITKNRVKSFLKNTVG